MRPRVHFWASCLTLGVVFAVGCRSVRQDPSAGSPRAAEDNPAAMERRIEAHARYATAIIHDLNEQTEQAVENYHQAALHDLDNERLVLDVTRRFLQLKENELALELLEKATARKSASANLLTRLALVHAALGDRDAAIAACRRAIDQDPRSILAHQQLAQLLIQKGDYKEAARLIMEASRQSESDLPLQIDLADLCLSLARADESQAESMRALAREILERADRIGTDNPLFLQKLADSFSILGETDRASELYLRILDRYPHLPGLRERLIEIYLRAEDQEKAAQQLEAILASNPTNMRAHYLLGSLAYEQEDMAKARDHFKRVILLNPDFEQAYYDLAGTLIGLNEAGAALETLEQAREKFDERFLIEFYTAMAHGRLEEYGEALKHFEAAEVIARATETNRLNQAFYFQLGAAYERNKQFTEAERYFRKCLELAPDYSIALNYLGYMWAEQGENLEEARDLIEQALELEPDNGAYLDSMAWVLFKMKRPAEALDYILRAMEKIEEPDPVLFDHLGDIYTALDQPAKAEEAWRKSIEIEPNEEVRKKLGPTSSPEQARTQEE